MARIAQLVSALSTVFTGFLTYRAMAAQTKGVGGSKVNLASPPVPRARAFVHSPSMRSKKDVKAGPDAGKGNETK